MIVLGLNAFGHDAAAVLLVDGCAVFASSEERFDRRRHSAAFPEQAIRAAFDRAGVDPADVDAVAFPWTRGMGRLRKAAYILRHLPRSTAFLREAPDDRLPGRTDYLKAMARLPRRLREAGIRAPLVRVPHHLAHAVSAGLALPAGRGAVITADGMGEWTAAAAWDASDGVPRRLRRASYPHSPGKAYAAVTRWLGFRPESQEGKTMGLAAYGDPEGAGAAFARDLIRPDARRLLRVRLDRFSYPWGEARLFGDAFVEHLGPPRPPASALRRGDADVAHGIQQAVETVMLDAARRLLAETGATHLGLAGGVFLNCALNGHLSRNLDATVLPFPVAGDAGAAWGAAAHVHRTRTGRPALPLTTLHLGHEITTDEASSALDRPTPPTPELARAIAARVIDGKVVAVARGRAEFGPRALGARSLLASPCSRALRDLVNARKGREAWRPLAPIVREGDAHHFPCLGASPWMILTVAASESARAEIAGAIHEDGTARVQTVAADGDGLLPHVLDALEEAGHPPVVLNTSLNRPGEPIVNTAAQALTAARAMRVDAIVLADHLLDLPGKALPSTPEETLRQ